MRPERKPIRDLAKKINFLQRSQVAQDICKHRNSQLNFAEVLGIPRETLREAVRYDKMSEDDQATLARACKFDLLWPEWNDTTNQQRDTALKFEARYTQEHTINKVQQPARIQSEDPSAALANAPAKSAVLARDVAHATSSPDRMTLEDFVARLDLSHVRVVRIIATTGKVTVTQLLQSLQDAAKRGHAGTIDVQILLSAAYMSDAGRPAGLALTRQVIREFQVRNRGFAVDVRSYSAPAMFRGAIVEHTDGTYSGHLGHYFWGSSSELERQSRWNRHGLVHLQSHTIEPVLEVCLSWFRHYWGTAIINTIIFDFDDTIFATTDAQVAGWVGAIQRSVGEGIIDAAQLRPAFAHLPQGGPRASADIKAVFLKEQTEPRILASLFTEPLPAKAQRRLRSARLEVREERTENASVPMQVILGDVAKLCGSYRLVIVSAASEEMVNRVLLKHDIGYFSYVYGRNPNRTNPEWREVETKSQLFIRLSSMLGVPLERMIFVGDSDSDYRAATQLGIPFIENAYNAKSCGMESLISSNAGARAIISGTVPGELIDSIRKIEAQILERWKRV